ncbi:MAG: hypothetical protein ABFR62_01395 [Bacteroidota bacterium]
MKQSKISPYLTFNGNCKEAMEHYNSILGVKLELMTFEESPMEIDDVTKSKIMHSSLIYQLNYGMRC